jgi:glucose/mannose-6-phosphate isomerase
VTLLDDVEAIGRLDSLGVLAAVEDFPGQVERGWALGASAAGLPDAAGLDSLIVLGMGGSAAAGDAIGAFTEPRFPIPFVVHKGYDPLPEWVGRNTLAIAISYSGNTEETLAAFEDAHARGARLISISSGGRLGELASEFGAAHVEIPNGMQPRAALGILMLPVLSVLQRMGLVPSLDDDVAASVAHLSDMVSRCDRRSKAVSNPAKDLAMRLEGKIPVIYGSRGLGVAIARRFKCDINEYAKLPAFFNELPEMDHNEICAWSEGVARSPHAAVLIRDAVVHPRLGARFDITRRIIRDTHADVVELSTEGDRRLIRLLSTLYLTQLTAIYLAILRNVDPGPVEAIERIKRELGAREGAIT